MAIIYASNNDGIRFSIRSEYKDINAEDLIAQALSGIGNGGSHPTMAGGMIPKKNVISLGNGLHTFIFDRFLDAETIVKKNVP